MSTYSAVWSSFNNGELSPRLDGRVDMPQYMKGGRICLNWLPTVQGPLVRRGGTRLIGSTLNSQNPSLLVPFSRSRTESYLLEFGDGVLRLWFNGQIVLAPSNIPLIFNTPYLQQELFNSDGTPALSWVESIDRLYIAHPNHPPYVLSFFGPQVWTLNPLDYFDGPWQDPNTNQALAMYISGGVTIGSVILIHTSPATPFFQAGHIGSLMRIHQQDLSTVKPWQPGQKTPVIAVGVQRRSGFNTYQATNTAPGPVPAGGVTFDYTRTGGSTLTQTEGAAWDGDQTTELTAVGGTHWFSTGVQWAYQDCGYGVAQITGVFIDGTGAVATVKRQFPVATLGAPGSWHWEMGAWNTLNGYPSQATFFDQRLTFANGERVWMSVTADFPDFADLQFGQLLADSALTTSILSDQYNRVRWMAPMDVLIVGTEGGEFIIKQQSISDPFGPTNFGVAPQSNYGGRAAGSVRVQTNVLFVQQNGLALREFSYVFAQDSYQSRDMTVQSDHITESGIIQISWAKNPHYIAWCALANGKLIGFTYNPEQAVAGWHRHDLAADGQVVSMASIPSVDGTVDDLYLCVRRENVVAGFASPFYQIERMEQPFNNVAGAAQQDAFYVDSGLTLDNSINASLLIAGDYTTQGATGVTFNAGSAVFAATDIDRYIHYDWMTTEIRADGLRYPLAMRGIALITAFTNSSAVIGTIIAAFPNLNFAAIPANGWRMTVTRLLQSSIPLAWYGRTVSLLLDGAAVPDVEYPETASVGDDILLPIPASIVQAGLKSPAVWQSMKPDQGGDQTGSALGKLRRAVKTTVRVLDELGLKAGRDLKHIDPIDLPNFAQPNDNVPLLREGDSDRITLNMEFDRDGRIMVVADQPLPATLCALAAVIEEEEDS